jgi:hypothetical protein
MPADYLSRLPSLPVNALLHRMLQCQEQDLQAIFQFLNTGKWHSSITKQKIRVLAALAKVFFDKNKMAWIRLEDHNYPHTAL